jgi:hypothetical protein
LLAALCSEAEKLEAAEEEGRNNDVWAGMEADDPELQAALIRAGGLAGVSNIIVKLASLCCQAGSRQAHLLMSLALEWNTLQVPPLAKVVTTTASSSSTPWDSSRSVLSMSQLPACLWAS